jgi:hypothetical protein
MNHHTREQIENTCELCSIDPCECRIGKMPNKLVNAGSIYYPSMRLVEKLGYRIDIWNDGSSDTVIATDKDGNTLYAKTYMEILGLIKMVECYGWEAWKEIPVNVFGK